MAEYHIPLRVVFYKEDDDWIAHCLEFDLVGNGLTKERALENLTHAIGIQLSESFEHRNIKNLFSPAPGEYFQRFAAGKNTAVGNLKVCFEDLARAHSEPLAFDDVQVREYLELERESEEPKYVPA